jgi:hypothetical protein
MDQEKTVRDVFEKVICETATVVENAVALHDYVRDQVKFGFNKYFDAASPAYTLTFGVGHCNPKSRLMVALFRELGLEAYQHFVVIPKDILKGAIPPAQFWMIPAETSHSYVDVNLEGACCAIDSFIIDTAYLAGAQARLRREGCSIGYGVRLDSTNTWNGKSNAFAQFAQSTMMVEVHGHVDDLEAYFGSKKYRGRAFGMSFNTLFKFMGEAGVAPMNANIERIRQY